MEEFGGGGSLPVFLFRPTAGFRSAAEMYRYAKGNRSFLQRLKREKCLRIHSGCVNTLSWSDCGTYLLSGSDDLHLGITQPFTGKVICRVTANHPANIFNARFLPGTGCAQIVSSSADGRVCCTNVERPEDAQHDIFTCHTRTTYKVVPLPSDGRSFLTCSEDGTVRHFDLRIKTRCVERHCTENILMSQQFGINSLDVDPISTYYLATGSGDATVKIYDRRMLPGMRGNNMAVWCFKPDGWTSSTMSRVTSLAYNRDGSRLLASFSPRHVHLLTAKDGEEEVDLQRTADGAHCLQTDTESASLRPSSSSSTAGASPPSRRVRLRGDWSDTGPRSVPESELREQDLPPVDRLMRGMSRLMSRLLSDRSSVRTSPVGRSAAATATVAEEHIAAASSSSDRGLTDDRVTASSTAAAETTASDSAQSLANKPHSRDEHTRACTLPRDASTKGGRVSGDDRASEPTGTLGSDGSRDGCSVASRRLKSVMRFSGHRNARTVIKEASFFGERFIVSGSDCGHIFVWDRYTGKIVNILEADTRVVNSVQPHPTLPMLASSGIDYDVKIWAPLQRDSNVNEAALNEVVARNERILSETDSDVVTVPASFVLRFLAMMARREGTAAQNDS